MNIVEKIDEWFPRMIQWRRYLHQHPELSYQESNTAAFVADHLVKLGLQVEINIGGHGVVGLLVGNLPGPTVALRADMDALPIQDEKTAEYASQVPGVMHACGHDAHTATLLGLAYMFTESRSTLAGTIKFIFQPAEEVSPGGALPMIQQGVLKDIDVIFGVHLWTPFPVGKVYCRSGAFMAAADEFSIVVNGKGGHGGLPHETIDSVMIGAQLVTSLQTIVSRNMDPTVPAVVSVGAIHAGKSFNVIAERCALLGTVRTFSSDVRDQIEQRMVDMSNAICAAYGASCEFEYKVGYPPVVNHIRETDRFFKVGRKIFGMENVVESPLIMAGEDYAYYLQKIPGCFMFVGAGNADRGVSVPHHHPYFDIDEEAMRNAALLLAGMTLDYLGQGNG